MSWHPADFLEFWVDENIDQQPINLKNAEQFAKRFKADAAAQGFTLETFDFNEASLMRHMVQSMAAPRV